MRSKPGVENDMGAANHSPRTGFNEGKQRLSTELYRHQAQLAPHLFTTPFLHWFWNTFP